MFILVLNLIKFSANRVCLETYDGNLSKFTLISHKKVPSQGYRNLRWVSDVRDTSNTISREHSILRYIGRPI